ncbi:MAG: hypothetical protein QOK40_266 [Miltoncostaeaceae bacterium]|nr:hypothetical protein [Miltoncostaeaceae bacterium]
MVKVSSLEEPGYSSRYAGARRVAPGAAVPAAAPGWDAQSAPSTLGGLPAAPAAAPGGPPTLAGLPAAQAPAGGSGSTLGGLVSVPSPTAAATAIDPASLPSPGDGAAPEAVARWMASAAAARGLPPELPVMASLAETGLRNLPYEDRDSLGVFQQRPSQGWGTPEQVIDPYHALGIFLDRAAATDVGGRFSARGAAGLGDWCQAVQISGFAERFQEQLPRAGALLASPVG